MTRTLSIVSLAVLALVLAGPAASAVLRQAGAIDFYCRFHPGMTGRLVVGR
jgi:plastocyanin